MAIILTTHEVIQITRIKSIAVFDNDFAETLVVEKPIPFITRWNNCRISKRVPILAKICHRDNEVSLTQDGFVWHRPVVKLEFIGLETTTDYEVARGQKNVTNCVILEKLSFEGEPVLDINEFAE
jgi:hypothetical protein